MSSSAKNKKAAGAIKELSADIFYAKVREEPGEEKLIGSEEASGTTAVSDVNFVADDRNVSGRNISADTNNESGAKNIPGEVELSDTKNSPSNEIESSQENIPENLIFATEENVLGEQEILSNKKIDTKTSPAIGFTPEYDPDSEINSASEKYLAHTISSDKKILPPEEVALPRSIKPVIEPIYEQKQVFIPGKENISGDNNINNKLYGLKESSSSYNSLIKTTTKNDSDEENIADDKFIVTSSPRGRRNSPIEDYKGPLFELTDLIGMSSLGMLMLLRHVLPSEGGIIRVNALARSIGMSANNIRVQLELLQSKGLIATHSGGNEGKWVSFTHDLLKSIENPFKTSDLANDTAQNMPGKIFSVGKFTYPLRCKEFFFSCNKIGKTPEDFQPLVIDRWIAVNESSTNVHAVALILEFLPQAKTNASAFLHSIMEKQVMPSQGKMTAAQELLEAAGDVIKKIGEEILPKDWMRAAESLGFRIRQGTIQELISQQTVIEDRIENFTRIIEQQQRKKIR